MTPIQLGSIQVTRVVEYEGPTSPGFLFPRLERERLEPYLDWLAPRFVDRETFRLVMSVHSFVVRTSHHTILVDTCLGNDKPRSYDPWNMRQGTYLEDLQASGIHPDQVDFVLCTHLHTDHVGWNTRLEDGRWVPTFPNAKYIFARKEWEHWSASDDPEDLMVIGDSVSPVVEAGQALLVEADHALDDEIWLEPTHGHTPGHVSIHLASAGKEGVITGDMIHHPLQMALPDVTSFACVDPAQAIATRREFLARYADLETLILGTHFATPTVGHVVSQGSAWRLKPQGE